jgi:hypothetical protein
MFTVIQAGRVTVTKREGLNWLQAVNEATQFVSASTTDNELGSRLLVAIQEAAGTGEPVALPNGKTLEIDFIED